MTRVTDGVVGRSLEGPAGGLGYPVAAAVARAARGPNGRDGPGREQDGTAQ
jgi:hypothetical protein